MTKQTELASLVKGNRVDHFLLVRRNEVRLTKNQKPYLSLELGDQSLTLSANVWDNYEEQVPGLKNGDLVKVKGHIEEYQNANQIKVDTIRLAIPSDGVSSSDFLPKSKRNPEEMKKEFTARIQKIRDKKLKQLITLVFDDENFQKFSVSPAGKMWHHGYLHGLIEHTLEIIKICDLMSDIHPDINRDLLVCGAMLHDFGKIEELNSDTSFEYTDKGKLLGHITIAAMIVNEKINLIKEFPEELKNSLLHLILSHQGKLEHASPVVPKTVEAIALYQADELSAKVNAYKNAIQTELKSDSKWTKYIQLAGTDLYGQDLIKEEQEKKTLFDD
ncbi:MAG: HD domain-containing protein [Ignavibacteriales bacterium]|nr:MAG: HD domain-containing protein [Ignavibacteriales bacterium]